MISVITSFWKLLKGLLDKTVIVALIALFGIGRELKNKNITEERQKWLTGLKGDVAKFLSLLTNYDNNDKKEIEELYYCIIFNLNKKDKNIDTELVELLHEFKEEKFTGIKEDRINLFEKKFSMMFKFEWERIKTETNFWTFVPVLGWIINIIIIIFKRKNLIKMYSEDNDSGNKKTWILTTMDETIFKEIDNKIEIGNTIKSVDDIKKFLSEDRSLTNNDLKRLKKILKLKSEEKVLDTGSILLNAFIILSSIAAVFISMISLLDISELIKFMPTEDKEEEKRLFKKLSKYTLEKIDAISGLNDLIKFIFLALLIIAIISIYFKKKDKKVKNKYKLAIIAIDELLEGQDIDK